MARKKATKNSTKKTEKTLNADITTSKNKKTKKKTAKKTTRNAVVLNKVKDEIKSLANSPREEKILNDLMKTIAKNAKFKSVETFERALQETINSVLLQNVIYATETEEGNTINLIAAPLQQKVKYVKNTFPEIEYLEEIVASLAVYSSDDKLGYKKSPGIIYSIILTPKTPEAIKQLNEKTSKKVPYDATRLSDVLTYAVREEINDLFEDNDVHFQLIEAVKSIIEYGFFVVHFSKDYKYFMILNLEDITIKEAKENLHEGVVGAQILDVFNALRESSEEDIDSQLFTPVSELYKDMKIVVETKDGAKLDPSRTYIVSNSSRKVFGKSKMEKIVKYCQLLSMLEVSNLLERLAKSKLLNLLLIDISDLDEEDTAAYMALYTNILKNKLSFDIPEDGDGSSPTGQKFNFLKSLIDNFAILPVEGKDKIRVEQIKSEYKPIYKDIDYYQDKIYTTLGIPVYYRTNPAEMKSIPKEAIRVHDTAFSATIIQYQSYLNKFLTEQIEIYFETKGFEVNYVSVSLPTYNPQKRDKETDIQRLEKFTKTMVDLQNLLGIQIKPKFILSFLFPEYHPSDIAEGFDDEEQLVGMYTEEDLKEISPLSEKTENQEEKTDEEQKENINKEKETDLANVLDNLEEESKDDKQNKDEKELLKNEEENKEIDELASILKELRSSVSHKKVNALKRALNAAVEYLESNSEGNELKIEKFVYSIKKALGINTIVDVGYVKFF